MSLLVVGLSYRTAPLDLLERAALSLEDCRALELALCRTDHVAEAVVLGTCNRLEIYAEVSKFHNSVVDIGAALSGVTGIALPELTEHLFVHYEDAAVSHLFEVACGLDSMAVGEQQILGQVRLALRGAQETGAAGRSLHAAVQQALRVGKRAHTETGLDRAGHSLVEAGLDGAELAVGSLDRARILVVGAGAMSGLAVATAARRAPAALVVTNRTAERAERLAGGVGARVASFAQLADSLVEADVVISCTGAVGHVIEAADARRAQALRGGRPQVFVDLALPRDVAGDVGDVDGVTVLDLEALGHRLASSTATADVADVRALVAEEVEAFLARQRAEAVSPTVVALRAMARSVVESELTRLAGRLGDMDATMRSEVEQTVHRVVEKLLHTPMVRVKQLAGEPGGGNYAEALRELFGLDLGGVNTVSGAAVAGPGTGGAA